MPSRALALLLMRRLLRCMSLDVAHLLRQRRCSDWVCFLRVFCRADGASGRLTIDPNPDQTACRLQDMALDSITQGRPFKLWLGVHDYRQHPIDGKPNPDGSLWSF